MKIITYKQIVLLLAFIFSMDTSFSQTGIIYGVIQTGKKVVIPNVQINLKSTDGVEGRILKTHSDENGNYIFRNIPYGKYTIEFESEAFIPESEILELNSKQLEMNKTLSKPIKVFDQLEFFGEQNKAPEKLDAITRLPLMPNEQIQSISVVSEKLIESQGSLTISEASRNVPGVYTYATFGGVRESMSSRGFRGIPVLKNGVRIQSDFRGPGFSTDLAGVESIQVLKGANSITMGAATDLGSPGGIINIVTKTPKFRNQGMVSMRVGSFHQFRPTFDVQQVLGKEGKLAFRVNGAYENSRTFHNIKGVGQNKLYLNPSLAWRPDEKTEIVLEMDHLYDVKAFDPGTVNLSPNNVENNILEMPIDRFLGFQGNNSTQKTTTFTARFRRDLANKLYVRGAVYYANYNSDAIISSLKALDSNDSLGINVNENAFYKRSLGRNNVRTDKNLVVQVDLIGHKLETGIFKHTFQAGIDYRTTNVKTSTYNSILVDTINVRGEVGNQLPESVEDFNLLNEDFSNSNSVGLSVQEVLEITKYVRLFGGVRFGISNSSSPVSNEVVNDYFVNPIGGIMLNVWKDINIFGSYTNSTNPRSATYKDVNGNPLGNETIAQYEAGFKTSWFKDRLRFNATYYFISNKGMNLQAAIENPETGLVELQNYYFKGGNDERQGAEVELTGRILPNLELIVGYAYIHARYKEHTTFVPGSIPNNTPTHTANIYVNYSLEKSALRGLSVGVGYYYIGERPYNDWTQSNVEYHGITPNLEPWNNKAYGLLNAQIGYDFKYYKNQVIKNFDLRVIGNNLLNEVGYDAYRTNFINRINPMNFSFVISYKF